MSNNVSKICTDITRKQIEFINFFRKTNAYCSVTAFVCTSESYELFKWWSFLQYSNTNKEYVYMYRSAPLHLNNITVSLQ